MLATICGRFRLELAPEMGGEAGVLEKQISSFTLAVDGGLHMHFHDRAKVPCRLICHIANPSASSSDPKTSNAGHLARPDLQSPSQESSAAFSSSGERPLK